jgi:hypothetical protein
MPAVRSRLARGPRFVGSVPTRRSDLARFALAAAVAASAFALAAPATAEDDFGGGSVIFARGSSLYRVDARGKDETEIAQLASQPAPPAPGAMDAGGSSASAAAPAAVRALRSDATGTVLLVDLAGTWAWMPLDGSTRSLTELPCGDGPAQLADDGSAVLCRSARAPRQSILVELRGAAGAASVNAPSAGAPPSKPTANAGTAPAIASLPSAGAAIAAGAASAAARIIPLDVPPGAARLVGSGAERKLVWADATGVWSAPPNDLRRKTRAAQDVPLRGFLPSPDGARAVGVYADQVFADLHRRRSAEVLMTLQLDGQGARRKAIRDGVPVEWSHDADWLLVQDGSSTCIMRITGGQYKCWRGLTAASLSPDGRWALALGNRDGSRQSAKSRKPTKPAPKAAPKPPPPDRDLAPQADDKPWDHIDEPSDEPEAGGPAPVLDDVSVAPPSGPLSLYRLRLEGAFTDRPTLLVKIVDGAAVWVPGPP